MEMEGQDVVISRVIAEPRNEKSHVAIPGNRLVHPLNPCPLCPGKLNTISLIKIRIPELVFLYVQENGNLPIPGSLVKT